MAANTKSKKSTSGKNDSWKHDSEYIRYVESGRSAAVFVVRDVVQAVNTSGRWIDIISLDHYKEELNGNAFNWIVCELFPRKIQPEYVEPETEDPKDVQEARDHNRYLTWQTAQIDISQQRSKGYNGPKFLVLCKLINHNKDKFVKLTLTGSMKTYRDSDGAIWEVLEPPEERETIKAFSAPDWEYRITFLKRLSDEQAEYIQSHEVQIRDNIELNGKVTPEIMGIK